MRTLGRGWCIVHAMDVRVVDRGTRWTASVLALGCLALGCDAPAEGSGKESAGATAKAEPERGAAGGETKAAGIETRAADGEAKKGGSAEVGSAAVSAESAEPAVPAEPANAVVAPATPTEPGAVVNPEGPSLPGPADPPSTPTEPGAADPATPTALPALSGVTPSEAAFSEKMQRRLRSKLREQHDARTQLASSLALPQPDGGVVVLALYEYSAYEACVGKSDGTPEARKECANPTDDNERVLAGLRKCTGRGLVRARFGPPSKAQPAYGGELTVEATRPLQGGCTISKVRGFALEDVDGDGQAELALDIVAKTPETTFRTETQYDVFTRTVGWYRTDLAPQYESALCKWFHESPEEADESTARRIRLEDEDGDGRNDLVVDEIGYFNDGECDLDDTGWLKKIGSDEACSGELETVVWRYDAGKDQWIAPAPSPR
jgi:hypothetical protein